ncbi:MAG: hypothetical protein LC667_09515, partial [Thioalkalivibrio sp.]|nr:hypothetical protein [Thioalkalivibrio sp.]
FVPVPWCSGDTFCFSEAAQAGKLGHLDEDTRQAAVSTASRLGRLGIVLKGSNNRKSESIHVLAHSHGTAMLLAAGEENAGGHYFKLDQILFVGSNLHPMINLNPLLRHANRLTSFYSYEDSVVSLVRGSGQRGFMRRNLNISYEVTDELNGRSVIHPWELRPNQTNFEQVKVPGIAHSADYDERLNQVVSWVSRSLAKKYYASILESRRPRPETYEADNWIKAYSNLRLEMGHFKQIDVNRRLLEKYVP